MARKWQSLVQGGATPSASGWEAEAAECYLETRLVWWALWALLAPGAVSVSPTGGSTVWSAWRQEGVGSTAWVLMRTHPLTQFSGPHLAFTLTSCSSCCQKTVPQGRLLLLDPYAWAPVSWPCIYRTWGVPGVRSVLATAS